MSQLQLSLKTGFVNAPLYQGIGRFVLQCQRITIKFCKNHGSSLGVRDWIQYDAVNFARANPSVVLYLKPRRHRSPVVIAEYLNGYRQWMSLHKFPQREVQLWLENLRTRGGSEEMHYKSYHRSWAPSVQGVWTPFTNKSPDKNLMKFPHEELSMPPNLAPTTTEIILDMYGKVPVIPKTEGVK